MKFVKKFENFVNDLNRESDSTDFLPGYNPVVKLGAEEWVDTIMSGSDFTILYKVSGLKKPSPDVTPDEFDKHFDDLREEAIKYYTEHPDAIRREISPKTGKPSGDGIPRMYGNVGGSGHANSIRVGE
jgi:hypothetical protein